MQEVIAGLERLVFAFEKDVETQKGTGLLPVRGMDKSGAAVCTFFAKGLCVKGKLCPFRHDPRGEDGGFGGGLQQGVSLPPREAGLQDPGLSVVRLRSLQTRSSV
uniref:Uncharacterized protein n=1 Tax=Rangifer tarandus platyrhynchus TaxID=3082113 RepID=A0ACB0EIF4_RANTA|nr:unnamed protein product [Rangifer tarandus platyrhynchus]